MVGKHSHNRWYCYEIDKVQSEKPASKQCVQVLDIVLCYLVGNRLHRHSVDSEPG